MSLSREQREGATLGFLESVMRLFGRAEAVRPPHAAEAVRPAGFHAGLEAALDELNRRIEEQRRAAAARGVADSDDGSRHGTGQERAEERQHRMEAAHRAIREDIEAMHARFETGIAGADLVQIAAGLRELAVDSSKGRNSHELLPRARYSIGERFRREAGELAVARLIALMKARGLEWPDPMHHRPGAPPEEERARARRLGDVRAAFLAQDFERAADGVLGVVRGWGSDYPDRGTPLWEETVLEAVAGAFRGRLVQTFIDVVRRDREQIMERMDETIGAQLASLQSVLADGVHSIEQANHAVSGCLRVIDEVLPELAWAHVRSVLPEARDAR